MNSGIGSFFYFYILASSSVGYFDFGLFLKYVETSMVKARCRVNVLVLCTL